MTKTRDEILKMLDKIRQIENKIEGLEVEYETAIEEYETAIEEFKPNLENWACFKCKTAYSAFVGIHKLHIPQVINGIVTCNKCGAEYTENEAIESWDRLNRIMAEMYDPKRIKNDNPRNSD